MRVSPRTVIHVPFLQVVDLLTRTLGSSFVFAVLAEEGAKDKAWAQLSRQLN